MAAPCLTTNLIISAESSLSVSDSSQRPVFDILRVRERTEDAGFDSDSLFSFTASRFCSREAACLRLRSHDFIILSTHGRTGLAHVFLGSTAEQVVRRTGCHVLIVREKEREFVRNTKRAIGRYRRSADVD
jgi:universal stress protein family protein